MSTSGLPDIYLHLNQECTWCNLITLLCTYRVWASTKLLKLNVQWHLYIIYIVTYHIQLWGLLVERNLLQMHSIS